LFIKLQAETLFVRGKATSVDETIGKNRMIIKIISKIVYNIEEFKNEAI
jgi:hypothetical protein